MIKLKISVLLLLLAIILTFAIQNIVNIDIKFIGWSISMPLSLTIILTFFTGVITGVLTLILLKKKNFNKKDTE